MENLMKRLVIPLFSFLTLAISTAAYAEDEQEFSEGQLEQILAPIALYPDSVLTHILIAATYPLEVVQAKRWQESHPNLEPKDALEQVEDKGWDPSVKALIPFDNVLARLSEDLEWTQQLGDAFLQSEARVLDSIQSLRQKAETAGNLDKMENVKVVREKKVIIIEPAEPEIVYVPYYDTRYVYGNWRWNHYPPVYWRHARYNRHHHGPFFWHPRVHIGFNFFFSAFHWHNHHLVVLNHRHYRHGRHYRRSEIIRHNNVRRWQHNPTHRRGLAYRTNVVRDRYQSRRPSQVQSRTIRQAERKSIDRRDVPSRAVNSRAVNTNAGIKARNNEPKRVTRENRTVRENRNITEPRTVTRHQNLKDKLSSRQTRSANRAKDPASRQIQPVRPTRNVDATRSNQRKDVIKKRPVKENSRAARPDVISRPQTTQRQATQRRATQQQAPQRQRVEAKAVKPVRTAPRTEPKRAERKAQKQETRQQRSRSRDTKPPARQRNNNRDRGNRGDRR